ncbi:alcohol dehydrogenase [Mycena galericulata]|nr:alcohol dehydrogenase [Mycena galericulata]
MASFTSLPPTHRALVVRSRTEPPKVEVLPTPQPERGAVIIRVLCSPALPYGLDAYSGKRPYPIPFPLVGGSSAIARVTAPGIEGASLQSGQLVLFSGVIAGRDNPDALFLIGLHGGDSDASNTLMRDAWRDSTWAEYARVPLESVDALDERRLLGAPEAGGLGYTLEELAFLPIMGVPFGGLDDIALRPGERVIVAPATGWFGGAAVMVALAMGARVIAAGRNAVALAEIKTRMGRVYGVDRIETVVLSGDEQTDTAAFKQFGAVDAFFEISPPMAAKATLICAAIRALRRGGRVSLMGGLLEDVPFPFRHIMHRNITIKGKWMCDREQIWRFIKLVEGGLLKLGERGGIEILGSWQLDEWEPAFKKAADNSTFGSVVVIKNFIE